MPLYEYQCARCAHCFTEYRSVQTRNIGAPCPKCPGLAKKIPSLPSVVYKTDGFYRTKQEQDKEDK